MHFSISCIFLVSILLIFINELAYCRNHKVYCTACQILVDESTHLISKTSPSETLEVGGFRIAPDGRQKLKEVPYLRSETHLMEVIEEACILAESYKSVFEPANQKMTFVRPKLHSGETLDLRDLSRYGEEFGPKLRFACESILADHEEDFMDMLKKDIPNLPTVFCVDHIELCESDELYNIEEASVRAAKTSSAVHDMLKKVEDKNEKETEANDEQENNENEEIEKSDSENEDSNVGPSSDRDIVDIDSATNDHEHEEL